MMLDRPHRIEAPLLGAVGEHHLCSPDLVSGSPIKVLEEGPMPNAHHRLPSLPMATVLNERIHLKTPKHVWEHISAPPHCERSLTLPRLGQGGSWLRMNT